MIKLMMQKTIDEKKATVPFSIGIIQLPYEGEIRIAIIESGIQTRENFHHAWKISSRIL